MAIFRIILPVAILFAACAPGPPAQKTLPVLGNKDWNENNDTIYHTIPPFRFWDQDSGEVTQETVAGKVYVTDFFFTTCPTICPIMKRQMFRLHERFLENDSVLLVSHTIDPEHDNVQVLREYADRMSIESRRWKLVTGDMDSIYKVAKDYFEYAAVDPAAPGGYIHSGKFYLIDPQRRVRGFYDGTVEKEVDRLMDDINLLLNE